MIAVPRKKINTFSLAFLDCICCGFGAVILLFVIMSMRSVEYRKQQTVDLNGEVDRIKMVVLDSKKQLVVARNAMEETEAEIVKTEGFSREIIKTIEQKQVELSRYDDDTLATAEHINKLQSDLRSLEEGVNRLEAGAKSNVPDGDSLRTFLGDGDRQYLTDLKVGGDHILILLDASASMLAERIVEIIRRRNMDETVQINAPKWQHAVRSVDWVITQLPHDRKFQLLVFNERVDAVITGSGGTWLEAGDPDLLNQAMAELKKYIPHDGTSLHLAFDAIKQFSPPPDNIFLLTDGLPTMAQKKGWGSKVSGKKRMSLFNSAIRRLPKGVPVNIILFPMEGDPHATGAYWQLAAASHGSLLAPPGDWP